jgi:hypothetical protein
MKRKLNNFSNSNKKQKIKHIYSNDIDLLIKMLKKLKLNDKIKNNFKYFCCSILPNDFKYSKKTLKLLKQISDDYLCRLFQLANIFRQYRNKKTLTVNDLTIAKYFLKN